MFNKACQVSPLLVSHSVVIVLWKRSRHRVNWKNPHWSILIIDLCFLKHLSLPNVNIPTHQCTSHNAPSCGVVTKYKRSTLHHKIAIMSLNSTSRTYPRVPNIWPSLARSLGLAEKRFYACRIKYVRIHKSAKFYRIWKDPTQRNCQLWSQISRVTSHAELSFCHSRHQQWKLSISSESFS